MNRNTTIALLVIPAALGAIRYQRYRASANETHRVVFKVEGPTSCHVDITTATGPTPSQPITEMLVPWESEAVEVHGHVTVRLSARFPVGCAPAQSVSCAIERDGAPWKDARGRALSTTRAEVSNVVCEIEADPAGAL